MSKAQERALEAYPIDIQLYVESREKPGEWLPVDSNLRERIGYQRGYEQAEKDLELTWEDMQLIWLICNTIKDTERKNPDIMCSSRAFFSEVLKRFEDAKNKDHKK